MKSVARRRNRGEQLSPRPPSSAGEKGSSPLLVVRCYRRRDHHREPPPAAPICCCSLEEMMSPVAYVMLVGAYLFEDPDDPRNFKKTITVKFSKRRPWSPGCGFTAIGVDEGDRRQGNDDGVLPYSDGQQATLGGGVAGGSPSTTLCFSSSINGNG
nr:serine/threonine-protein kinase SRK2 [Ipomoea trifida]